MLLQILLVTLLAAPQQNPLPRHLAGAVQRLNTGDAAGAISELEALLSDDPEDGMAWYFMGLARHNAGQLDEAARGHLLARLLLGPGHPLATNATYNMACVYALKGNTERGLRWLHRARNAGFADSGLLSTDSDLDALRDDPRFDAFVASLDLAPAGVGAVTVDSPAGLLRGGTGGVTFAPDGGLFVADFGDRVYHVSADGEARVHATGFGKAADCTVDGEGRLLQVDFGDSRLLRVAPDGTVSDTGVSGLSGPVGIDIADDGAIYVTNFNARAICAVELGQPAVTISQGGLLNGPNGLAVVGERIYVCNFSDGCVLSLDRETGEQRFVAELPGGGNGHIAWADGALWVTDRKGHRVVRLTPDGETRVVAGTGTQGTADGSGATATLSLPNGIAVSEDGSTVWTNDNVGGQQSVVRRIRIGDG